MPPASRVHDQALCPADVHGKICCPHVVTGPEEFKRAYDEDYAVITELAKSLRK